MQNSFGALSDLSIHSRPAPELFVPFINNSNVEQLSMLSDLLDVFPRQAILNNSWPQYVTDCCASFCMAYSTKVLIVKFFVEDDFFRSFQRPVNGQVHLDNCVEFFVQFNNDPGYYNIEFNCLGCGKVGYGLPKQKRTYLSESLVRGIDTLVRADAMSGKFNWEITLKIPASTFKYHDITINEHLKCRGNFFKCGDLLPQPHFLTWSSIEANAPNFHVPEAFGTIYFDGVTLA